jgi:predicted nicotinamide N-methyase
MEGPDFLRTVPTSGLPPTAFLPPLARLRAHATQDISFAVQRLRDMYWPPRAPFPPELGLPNRPIVRFTHDKSCPDSGYASAEEEEDAEDISIYYDDLEILRADPLERAFAIRWITGFISRSETWIDLSISDEENEIRTQLLDEVSSLLSMFGTDHSAEGGELARPFSFPSPGGLVNIELNDAALLDDDHTSVGLQSWGSAIVLARKLCADPGCFSLYPADGGAMRPLRVLELGAGTGMLSIVAAKILHSAFLPPVIIATDYHAEVLSNLSANVRANFPPQSYTRLPVMVHVLDWENPVYSAPLDGMFDIVLAADVVYHPEHARLIKGCIERVLARSGTFWMIMALRSSGRHEGLDGTVDEMFPDASVVGKGTLAVLERTDMERLEGVGRADENEYRLFKIGWKGATDTLA